jgi:hypothetical protein
VRSPQVRFLTHLRRREIPAHYSKRKNKCRARYVMSIGSLASQPPAVQISLRYRIQSTTEQALSSANLIILDVWTFEGRTTIDGSAHSVQSCSLRHGSFQSSGQARSFGVVTIGFADLKMICSSATTTGLWVCFEHHSHCRRRIDWSCGCRC